MFGQRHKAAVESNVGALPTQLCDFIEDVGRRSNGGRRDAVVSLKSLLNGPGVARRFGRGSFRKTLVLWYQSHLGARLESANHGDKNKNRNREKRHNRDA